MWVPPRLLAPYLLLFHLGGSGYTACPPLTRYLDQECLRTQLTDLPFVHPVRVKAMRNVTLPVMVVWVAALTVGVLKFPDAPRQLHPVLIACPIYFAALTLRQWVIESRSVTIA